MAEQDAVVIVLSALAVILTALAIIIAVLGVFGYSNIRLAAIAAATEAAKEVAPEAARIAATAHTEKIVPDLVQLQVDAITPRPGAAAVRETLRNGEDGPANDVLARRQQETEEAKGRPK